MNASSREGRSPGFRKERDSLGQVNVPDDKLWGAQTQRSLQYFSIGKDRMPSEMITAYAILKKAAANANYAGGRLDAERHRLILATSVPAAAGPDHAHQAERQGRQYVRVAVRANHDLHHRAELHRGHDGEQSEQGARIRGHLSAIFQ